MLSYRHAFHAGNHADVLKHFILFEVLRYYSLKDKPWWYIDTHAGAGCYALDGQYAGKTGEYRDGIARLWQAGACPTALQGYLDAIAQFNPDGALRVYPGSPALAMTVLREQDRMRLFELHPSDYELLAQTFATEKQRVTVRKEDGFAALKALLPPPSRRAVVLIDPPYEVKEDYRTVVNVLGDALRRFASGTYMVWYPALNRPEARRLPERLIGLGAQNWLDVRLFVKRASPDGMGMHGSGMFLINPPWTLPQQLADVLPWLAKQLDLDGQAGFELNHQIS